MTSRRLVSLVTLALLGIVSAGILALQLWGTGIGCLIWNC